MTRLPTILLAALSSAPSWAQDSEGPWLQTWGAGGLEWGTSGQPLDIKPRSNAYQLPDSGYVGRNATDKPSDYEVAGPAGERRFLRYVGGQLADAWWVVSGEIDVADYKTSGTEEWNGTVLGPSTDGFRAFGTGTSWLVQGRTVFHWVQRDGSTQILASRALPNGTYNVARAAPLPPDSPTKANAKISGSLAETFKRYEAELSGCFEHAAKPVEATVSVEYDKKGRPARIKVNSDQVAFNVEECVAGVVAHTTAEDGAAGSFKVYRFR